MGPVSNNFRGIKSVCVDIKRLVSIVLLMPESQSWTLIQVVNVSSRVDVHVLMHISYSFTCSIHSSVVLMINSHLKMIAVVMMYNIFMCHTYHMSALVISVGNILGPYLDVFHNLFNALLISRVSFSTTKFNC